MATEPKTPNLLDQLIFIEALCDPKILLLNITPDRKRIFEAVRDDLRKRLKKKKK